LEETLQVVTFINAICILVFIMSEKTFFNRMGTPSKLLILAGAVLIILAIGGVTLSLLGYDFKINIEPCCGGAGIIPDVNETPVVPVVGDRCVDSDQGKDYATAGMCVDNGENKDGIFDVCSDNTLTEYYCNGIVCAQEARDCAEGEYCDDGACKEWSAMCTDSDIENDPYVRGVVDYYPNGVKTVSGDKCLSTGFLRQYDCDATKSNGLTFIDSSCGPTEECFWGVCTTNASAGDDGTGDGAGDGDGGDDGGDGGLLCGNMQLDTGEECDDGNNINGDGCSANCQYYGTVDANSNCAGDATGWNILLKTNQGNCLGMLVAHPKIMGIPIGSNYVCCEPTCGGYAANDPFGAGATCLEFVLSEEGFSCPAGYLAEELTGPNNAPLSCPSNIAPLGCCIPDPCPVPGSYCGDMPADFACDARGPGYFASDENFCLDGVSCCEPVGDGP